MVAKLQPSEKNCEIGAYCVVICLLTLIINVFPFQLLRQIEMMISVLMGKVANSFNSLGSPDREIDWFWQISHEFLLTSNERKKISIFQGHFILHMKFTIDEIFRQFWLLSTIWRRYNFGVHNWIWWRFLLPYQALLLESLWTTLLRWLWSQVLIYEGK